MARYELKSARFLASDHLRNHLKPGDTAVDATMGNGNDTQLLCELVGEGGHVYGFDVQQQALEHTRRRLASAGLLTQAQLFKVGHQHLSDYVKGPIQAVVFNLGWLPGTAKQIRTQWETTKIAVTSALELLEPLGICVICVYPGHVEGDTERIGLLEMLSSLRPQAYNVLHQCFINARVGAPECFLIQKQEKSSSCKT